MFCKYYQLHMFPWCLNQNCSNGKFMMWTISLTFNLNLYPRKWVVYFIANYIVYIAGQFWHSHCIVGSFGELHKSLGNYIGLCTFQFCVIYVSINMSNTKSTGVLKRNAKYECKHKDWQSWYNRFNNRRLYTIQQSDDNENVPETCHQRIHPT